MIGPWFLPQFVAATGLERVHYAVLLPTADTCVDRVVNRIGHGFTDEAATRHMHGQFASVLLARRHVIDEFTGDSSELVELIVARVGSGRLAYPG